MQTKATIGDRWPNTGERFRSRRGRISHSTKREGCAVSHRAALPRCESHAVRNTPEIIIRPPCQALAFGQSATLFIPHSHPAIFTLHVGHPITRLRKNKTYGRYQTHFFSQAEKLSFRTV